MKSPLHPSMKDVARVAKVSLMTVSLALRGHPSIPETTRKRITEIAGKMGYRPNPLISALMASLRSRRGMVSNPVIAFINPFPTKTHWANFSSLQRLRAGVQDRGNQLGFRVEEFQLGPGELTEGRLLGILRSRGIRGVVFAPFPRPSSCLDENWIGFACALTGYTLKTPHFHRAVNHQTNSLLLAFSELRNLGYRKIGLAISQHEDDRVEHQWLSNFLYERHCAQAKGVDLPLLLTETWDEASIIRWMRQNKPEALVTTNYELLELLIRNGYSIPDDLGFAHLHLLPKMRPCSGVEQNDYLVGAAALDLVVEQLNINTCGLPEVPKVVQIAGVWVAGNTTKIWAEKAESASAKTAGQRRSSRKI